MAHLLFLITKNDRSLLYTGQHKILSVRVSLIILKSVVKCIDRRNSSPIFISIDTNDDETMSKNGDDKSKDNDHNGGGSDPNSSSNHHQICEIAGRNERKRIVKSCET